MVARPTGRGPGSVYQGCGEVDVLEAIEFVAGLYPIDRDRITITGASMGGAATFYLASHAVTWGSHIDLQLVPDYNAYARGDLLEWGFWGNDWRAQPAG